MGWRFVAFWMILGKHDVVLAYETPTKQWRRGSRWC